ncbi:MAG TPA: histidine kinase [Puia sp.]|nr:histidine kinase [Puia sp.]
MTAILLLTLCVLTAHAQPFPEVRFVQLTEKDGLSCDKTSGVAQDADGVIWVSTNNGLNRFDGYGFTRFFANREDSTTIPANELESVTADSYGHLWIQSAGGICRFTAETYKVDRFDSGSRTPSAFRSFENSSFWFDPRGDAYVVSPKGLYHFSADGHYEEVDEAFHPYVLDQLLLTHYAGLVTDRRGRLWGYAGNQIYRVDSATKHPISVIDIKTESSVEGLFFDSEDRCWVSTWQGGILELDAAGGIRRIPCDRHLVLGKALEWRINGRRYIVFATNKPGLLLVDPLTGQSRDCLPPNLDGLGQPFIDRQNTLWLATSNGVLYANASPGLFDMIPIRTPALAPAQPTYITTPYNMRETPSGYWVARRYHGGVFWFTPDWKEIHHWGLVVDSVGRQIIEGAGTKREAYDFRQVGDTMYMSTEWGMLLLDLKSFRRTLIRDPGSPPLMRLRTIEPEDRNKWWVRSFSQGVFVFDPAANKFVRHYSLIPPNCNSCGLASANYLLRDRKGRTFVTTNAGMYRYDAALDSFVSVYPSGLLHFGNALFGMAEDRSGKVWVGMDDGICVYDPDSNRIMRVFTEGNAIGPVERMCIDSNQNVWFRSISAYWCWLRSHDRLIQFRIRDGLPDNDEGLFYTSSNGNVYAGCLGGVLLVHPDRIDRFTGTTNVRIMDALAGDKPIPITIGRTGEKHILLQPDQHNFQVVFDVINYDMPQNNLYFYRLSSSPGDWTRVENGRLSFNNLAPGEYTLSVKGGNKLTGLATATDSLLLTVLPYWYQSLWFRTLIGLVILSLIFLAVRWRIAHIHHEAEFRQKIADTELQALRAQMNPHFIFNSLNSIENFIMKNERWLASDYLNKFARLFRMILHSSRNELVPFARDLEALQLYVDLERLRYGNRFEYETDIDQQLVDGEFRVPSLLIQPYVENAIVHGLALSTRDDGYVQVSATLNGEYICYRITDNGVGRALAGEARRANNPNHQSVGLAITETRINIFSHQQNSAGRVTITDLSNEDGTAAGTRVEVMIKAV